MKIATQGYATTWRMDMDDAYRVIAEAGFEAIDWSLDCQWKNGRPVVCWDRDAIFSGKIKQDCIYDEDMDTIIAHYQPEIDTIKKYGLTITQAHSPFPAYDITNPAFMDYAIETYKKCIKLCEYAECPRIVVHGISRRPHEWDMTDEDVRALNMKLYTALIPTLKTSNVTVLLENLFASSNGRRYAGVCSNAYDAIEYIDTLNDLAGKECFGLCFDVGHLNIIHCSMHDYVLKLGNRIKALHIHDNDMNGDLHLAPYTGTVRWADFHDSLKKIGYTGDLSFETYRQTSVDVCEDEMVLPSLEFICKCGKFFRSKIQG